jgi:hypothetical protein
VVAMARRLVASFGEESIERLDLNVIGRRD